MKEYEIVSLLVSTIKIILLVFLTFKIDAIIELIKKGNDKQPFIVRDDSGITVERPLETLQPRYDNETKVMQKEAEKWKESNEVINPSL